MTTLTQWKSKLMEVINECYYNKTDIDEILNEFDNIQVIDDKNNIDVDGIYLYDDSE